MLTSCVSLLTFQPVVEIDMKQGKGGDSLHHQARKAHEGGSNHYCCTGLHDGPI